MTWRCVVTGMHIVCIPVLAFNKVLQAGPLKTTEMCSFTVQEARHVEWWLLPYRGSEENLCHAFFLALGRWWQSLTFFDNGCASNFFVVVWLSSYLLPTSPLRAILSPYFSESRLLGHLPSKVTFWDYRWVCVWGRGTFFLCFLIVYIQ